MTREQLHERAVKAARARWGKGAEEKPLTQAMLDEMRDELLHDHCPGGDVIVPWGCVGDGFLEDDKL